MINNNSYKKNFSEHSKINRIKRFLKSNAGFRIGLILICFGIIALFEFGLILLHLLGDFLSNDFLMSYAKQRMLILNINDGTVDGSTNFWFRFGFLSLLFGVIIGFLNIKTSPQPTIHSKKRFQRYLSLVLIILGLLFLIFPF